MCLDTVDRKPKMTEGEGWKQIAWANASVVRTMHQRVLLPVGKWITDSQHSTIPISGGRSYRSGYHVWLEERYCCRKVSFREVQVTGKQWGGAVAVAREIYIHPKEKK